MKDKPGLVKAGFNHLPGAILLLTVLGFGLNAAGLGGKSLRPNPPFRQQRSSPDSIKTVRQYFAALHATDSAAFKNEFEYEILLLLNPPQKRAYDSLRTLAARKAYIELYWKALNPNPLLPENDRLVDHLRRRSYVRANFSSPKPPYFDDRGKYHIKYGKPAFRYQDPGGIRRVSFFSPANYPQVQRLYPYKQAPEEFYMAAANETWSYENVTRDFVVHFIKEGVGFREITDLTDVLTSRQRRNLSWQWGDLIKQRAAVSPVLGRAAQRIEQFETTLIHAAAPQRRGELLMGDLQSPNEKIMEIAASNERETGKAKIAAPANAHETIKAVNRLTFSNAIAQFRGPNGFTRVDLIFYSPLKKNFVEQLDTLATDTVSAGFAWMLRNQNLDSLASYRTKREFPLKFAAMENFPNAVGCLSFVAAPQEAELSLQVQNRQDGRLGYSRKIFTIRDFTGNGLMLSDVQFYAEVQNENQNAVLPTFEKQNFMLAPYPHLKVRQSLPLFCYFEIYNLRAAGIKEAYEVTYKVISDLSQESLFKKFSRWLSGGKEAAISLSHQQAVVDDSAQELIAIDLGNLGSGTHRLEITVADANNAAIKTSVEREIIIEE